VESLTERLRGIQEALVVYANGAAQRVMTERSPQQEELFVALGGCPRNNPSGLSTHSCPV